jgi:PAS domain S-box-containing protein
MKQVDRFFDLSLDLMCVANVQGYFVKTNPAWMRTLGWSEEELCQCPYIDFVHPDDRESTVKEAAALAAGGVVVAFENRYRHHDGSYHWLAWNSVSTMEKGLVYCVARDVTERRRQLALMEEIQAVSGVGTWEIDLDTQQLYWSRMTHRIHGTNPDTYQPRLEDGLGFYPDEARAVLLPAVERLMTQGNPYVLDLPFLNIRGQRIWVRSTANATSSGGKVTRCFGTFQEVTQERRISEIEAVIRRMQSDFISTVDKLEAFNRVLGDILQLTGSAFGFIGEVFHRQDGSPFLKTHVISDTAWNVETVALYRDREQTGIEFNTIEPLFEEVIRSGQPVIVNAPATDPRRSGIPHEHPPLQSFLGLPVHLGMRLVAVVGVANRPQGYEAFWPEDLQPLLTSLGHMIEAERLERARERDRAEIARLSHMVSQSSNGMMITDSQGRTEWVNDGFVRLTGYTLEEMRGRTPGSVLQGPETDPAVIGKIRRALACNEGFEAELINYHKSGRPYWVSISASPVTDDSGQLQGFMAIETDITARRLAEDALRYERDLFSAGPVFSIEWDPAMHWPVRYVSANVRSILGYKPEEMHAPGFRYADLIHADDLERISREVAHNIAAGINQYEQSYRLLCKSGEYRWFYDFTLLARDRRNDVVSIHGYLFDQTQLRESEERIRQERTRLDHIITGTNVGTWEWNVQTGEAIFNERWAAIAGYTLTELAPVSIQTWLDLAHPDDLKEIEVLLQKHFRGELDYYAIESRMRHKDGHWVWVLDRGRVASRTADGQPLWMYGTHQDITERRRLENVKSEFVSTVSHELRTPLTSIAGSLGLLVAGVAGVLPEQAAQMLQIAWSNSQRLTLLINDLLDIEKITAGKMRLQLRRELLAETLEQVLREIAGYAERNGVSIVLAQPAPTISVQVDPARLLQVLSNLLSNAIKHSPRGGQVEVRAGQKVGIRTEQRGEPQPRTVRVEICDHGEGVPEAFRPSLFEKFSQADSSDRRSKGGTGLGLAISKALIEQMHGTIGYAPRAQGGSIFFIELPTTN